MTRQINIAEEVKKLQMKQHNLLQEIKEIDKTLKAYQRICSHEWKEDGYDSHHSYAKCTICGKEEQDIAI